MDFTEEELSDESRVAASYRAGNAEPAMEAVHSNAQPSVQPSSFPDEDFFRGVERMQVERFSAYTRNLAHDVILALFVGDDSIEPLGSARYLHWDACGRLPLTSLVENARRLDATGVLLFNRSCAELWKDRWLFEETRLLADALEYHQITLVDRHIEVTEWISLRCRGVFG